MPQPAGRSASVSLAQRREFDVSAGGQWVAGGHGEHDRLASQRDQLHAGWAVAGQRDEREVQASLLDLAGHLGGAARMTDAQRDVRVLGAEGGEQRGRGRSRACPGPAWCRARPFRAARRGLRRRRLARPAAAASVARASGSSARPESVSSTWCVERSNSVVAELRARGVRTPAETADWTTCSRSAARVKLPSSATATKVASCRSSTRENVIARRDHRQQCFALMAIRSSAIVAVA